MSNISLNRLETWLNDFLSRPDLNSKALVRKKWIWIWSVVVCFCVFGMTLLSLYLQIWIVFWYGVILLVFYFIYIPLLGPASNFETITFIFLLATILVTFSTILLLGGILTSLGLIFVGLTCALSSVLLNKAKITVLLFSIYAVTILLAAFFQPYLETPAAITPTVNLLYYVVNILWITSTTLIFILFYIKQQSQIEELEARRLKEMDEAKTRLYTHVTHEFRTPLTIILGMADLMEKNPEEWIKKGITQIRRKGQSLLHLVNQMLDLSRLETGLYTKSLVNSNISRYLRYLAGSFSPLAENKQITLQFSSSLEDFYMDFDPEKLTHIVSNLLSNAIKYTQPGGEIKLNVYLANPSEQKEELVIQVEDTGVGIEQKELTHIFDRFYRIQKDGITSEGSGLGLALTRELLELLNGRIEVDSTPGKGSSFFVYLPVIRTGEPLSMIDYESLEKSLPHYEFISQNIEYQKKVIENNQNDLPVLLIVEDNPDLVNYLIELLKEKYAIEVASNGKNGIEMAFHIIPDIIISDIMMPVMDGYEFLEKIKGDIRTSHIPVIVLTARADIPSKIKGLGKGADAYLSKPFNQEELYIRLEKLIEVRRNIQQYIRDFSQKKDLPDTPGLSMEIEFMQKINEIIEKNLHDENFGIEVLCREIPMSRTQLYRKFNALTDQPVSKFIRTIRLRKAKDLLVHQNLEVSEAAYRMGFKNLSHFSSAFKAEFGIAPSKIAGGENQFNSRNK